jgi:D-beta-D-heptose 7-phosphate kinase/D-beta-D-heptose 1-phosphate adenosyltransferase
MNYKVLLVGDVMLDKYSYGISTRISPESPVLIVDDIRQDFQLGGAGNVARNLSDLGLDVDFLTALGIDWAGEKIVELCLQSNINLINTRIEGNSTVKHRVITNGQQVLRMDENIGLSSKRRKEVLEIFKDIAHRYDIIAFSDYNKGVLYRLPEMLSIAKRHDIPTFIDPKIDRVDRYRQGYLLKPNEAEFQSMLAHYNLTFSEESIETLMKKGEIQNLLLTRGSKGMTLYTLDGSVEPSLLSYNFDALTKEVFDVTGAGDTVLASFIFGYAKGYSLPKCAELSNKAASIVVSKKGTSSIKREELIMDKIEENKESISKHITDFSRLNEVLQRDTQKIGFTNGCFDVLHAGHVHLLAESKKHCDILIVGVNTDRSVKSLKGPERPVNTLNNRIRLLEALTYVDFIFSFDEETPLDLIEKLDPDLMFKGSDYTEANIIGADYIKSKGGEVIIIERIEGLSTTNTLKNEQG